MGSKHIRPASEYGYPLLTAAWVSYLAHTQHCAVCKEAFKLHSLGGLCKQGRLLREEAKKSP